MKFPTILFILTLLTICVWADNWGWVEDNDWHKGSIPWVARIDFPDSTGECDTIAYLGVETVDDSMLMSYTYTPNPLLTPYTEVEMYEFTKTYLNLRINGKTYRIALEDIIE